jgi:glycosyltransferase involved in cell wall biosynthesis
MKLTIGMAVYDDFSGVYFTVQALRTYHDLTDVEILIIDNKGDKRLEDWVKSWCYNKVRYEKYTAVVGTTQPRQRVFDEAKGELVICIDSHVLLVPGSLDKLWDSDDLIHGIMYYDDLVTPVTHMKDKWQGDMWGVWDRKDPVPDEPFEIPMHGLGLFGCRKDSWLGFNPEFTGFGGEEGYIHEKFKQAGRKVICLPWIKWIHKFRNFAPYPLNIADRIRNYLLGFEELGLDNKPIYEHFGQRIVGSIHESLINR